MRLWPASAKAATSPSKLCVLGTAMMSPRGTATSSACSRRNGAGCAASAARPARGRRPSAPRPRGSRSLPRSGRAASLRCRRRTARRAGRARSCGPVRRVAADCRRPWDLGLHLAHMIGIGDAERRRARARSTASIASASASLVMVVAEQMQRAVDDQMRGMSLRPRCPSPPPRRADAVREDDVAEQTRRALGRARAARARPSGRTGRWSACPCRARRVERADLVVAR